MPSRFRTSFTSMAGLDPAFVVQGRVVNVNLVKWTVDVAAQFDRKKFFRIQVGSPYLHHSNGEGISIMPEVGATCMVTIPSDSSPPFVSSYVMASELIDDSSPDAPQGTNSHAQLAANVTDSTYAGGRPQAQLGDIWMRTRDDNFIILRRGGVLQIGATQLSQRIFIPLRNLVVDVSQNFEHHNTGGSIVWGLQEGPSTANPPTQFQQTFRVFANDQYADVRVAIGKVFAPIPEPDGGVNMAEAEVGQDPDSPIICEVTVSPKGFVAASGAPASASTGAQSVFKFVFDRAGNTLLRTEGNFLLQVDGQLTFKTTKAINFETQDAVTFTAQNGMDINGGAYTHIKGSVVRMGQGQSPAARMGDIVSTALVASPVLLTFMSPPLPGAPIACTLTTVAPMTGSISSGNQSVLV